jgi:phosphoglycerate-specific signal transduction histidine kinase
MAAPADPRAENGGKSGRDGDGPSSLELVHALTEPLTAIAHYLEAALKLHEADTPSARTKQYEALRKGQAQVSRAADVLHRLRAMLRAEHDSTDR